MTKRQRAYEPGEAWEEQDLDSMVEENAVNITLVEAAKDRVFSPYSLMRLSGHWLILEELGIDVPLRSIRDIQITRPGYDGPRRIFLPNARVYASSRLPPHRDLGRFVRKGELTIELHSGRKVAVELWPGELEIAFDALVDVWKM